MGLPTPQLAVTLLASLAAWTLLEYSLHRFLFHVKTRGYWANTFHYLMHGCHHKHPMDGMRLVFPPAATTIMLMPLGGLVKLLAPLIYVYAILGGALLGYVMYDCTHYYLHHGKPLTGMSQSLKRFHMDHHFRNQDKGFGITSTFWDIVFGTLPPPRSTKKSR
nr:dihydroceramide fatty acyl 2-hydroxylase FAH1-like [Ipomoea batatas]